MRDDLLARRLPIGGEQLGRLMSRFNLSWSIGNILGPYACGWLAHWHARLPLATGAAVVFLTAAYILIAARRNPDLRRELARPIGHDESHDGVDRSTPLRFPAWIGHFAAYFAAGAVAGIFPVGARDHLGFSATLIGVIFLIRGLLPWLIVWATVPRIGFLGALTATFRNDPRVTEAIESSAPILLAGGGTLPNMLSGGYDLDFVQNTPYGAGASDAAKAAAEAAKAEIKAKKPY